LFFLISFLTGPPLSAQVSLRQTTKQDQRFIDEKLANEFYRNQDWESAKAMYLKLYETYNAQHYYNYYFNCLIQLNQLDEAEKSARKRQRSTKEVQNEIDLGYILMLKGDQKKANNMFEKVISDMPADRNQINQISNTFRTRNLDEYALQTYEKGSMLPGVNYAFNLEKAGLYQMTGNYSATIDAYLAHLTTQPDHLDVVKNRLLSLMSMDIDNSMAELIRQKLLIKAQSDPNVLLYGELLIWYALQQKEYDIAMIQAQALDKRLGDRDFSVLELAEISLTNSQYEVALNGFNYIAAKGQNSIYYFQGSKGALKARYYLAIENQIADKEVYKKISDDIDVSFQKMGFNKETYDLAIIQANIFTYQLNKPTEANSILNQALSLPLQPNELAHLKMYQADILLYQNDVWEATLLYSQIDKSMKNEPIAHEARFRNARLRYFIGEFSWSQLQLDVLKAATSKLIANDALNLSLLIRDNLMDDTTGNSLRAFARADLLTFQKKDKEALLLLDSLADHDRTLSLKPHVLMKKAEILIRENRQAEADSIYALVFRGFADGYLADDALFRSAVLNEYQLNNIQKAGSLYEIIFDKYPASIYAAQARQKYRLLRGDSI
jgi:TolA-binding protein